jgi:hypothetical protein
MQLLFEWPFEYEWLRVKRRSWCPLKEHKRLNKIDFYLFIFCGKWARFEKRHHNCSLDTWCFITWVGKWCATTIIFNALNVDISLITQPIIYTVIIVLDMTMEITPQSSKQCTRTQLLWTNHKPIEWNYILGPLRSEHL